MPWIDVERPLALAMLVLVPALCWMAWRRRGVVGRGKSIATMVLRGALVTLLSLALAQPSLVRKGEGLTVMVVSDASRSVPQSMQQQAQKLVDGLVASKREAADRVGLVTFAGRPEVRAVAESDASLDVSQHGGDRMATGIEGALRRGMAMLPPDTASRMLLISDGNQTSGNAIEAAEAARANGIPIDVVALPFSHASEVMVESLRAPSTAREGQTIDLRASIRSMGPNRGVVTLRENGEPVDLDSSAPGTGLAVELKAGVNALTFPMVVVGRQSRRYELVYTPDDPASDAIAENNRGAAMVLVSTGAKVVIVDGSEGGEESQPLVAALAEGDIPSRVITPDELDNEGVSALADADAVVLANVGRFEITNETDQLLHSYVHDLGGGLLVTGGDRAFGAGGWQGSRASDAFAVKLEPPATRQLPKGALVLIMHSCEMAAGNYWGEKVAEAAVDALSRLDLAGIVTFDWGGKDGKLASWAHDLQPVGDKSAIRAAIKKMVVGDMPDFKASLSLAKGGLSKVNAGQKHVIIISDGDPSPPTQAELNELKQLKITVTTIMVGGHGTSIDLQNMRAVAEQTGGTFYNVQNPNLLPKIFTKEATLVSRTLILEQRIRPVVEQSTGGPMDGSGSLPEVTGWVVTVPREGLAQVPAVLPTNESRDPLVAYWNYGLGKSMAFTSDLGGRWGRSWATWSGYQPFWTRALRWMMRPPTAQDLLVSTSVDGDLGRVQVSAFTADGEPRDFLSSSATLMRPDGKVEVLDLQQTAPGQYVANFDAREQGAYLASVSARDGMGADRSARSVVSVPYPRELASTRDDSALLRRIAEVSGGRMIALKDASAVDFFDRSGLPMPEAAKRIWNVLAILAAALLIIDVAARRITLDREAARDLAAMAVGEGSKAGGATVEAWKRARSGARKAPNEPIAPAPTAPTKPDRRTTPSAPVEIVDRTQAKPGEPSSEAPPADDASSLARLRAAKRRARGEEDAS